MTAALYRSPQFIAASHLSRGAAWTLRESLRSLLAETRLEALPEGLVQLALACLPPPVRKLALGALLATGLAARTPAGLVLLEPDPHRVVVEPPAPPPRSSGADRQRRYLERKRQHQASRDASGDASPASVTPPVTGGVTAPVITPSLPPSQGVIPRENTGVEPVTPLASAPAREENSPSFSLPTFQKEEGEGEENSPPLPPPSRPAVTPAALPTLTGPLGSALAGALAAIPGAPRGEAPEGDPLEAQVARVAELWSQATGHSVDELRPRDLDAIRVRVQEGEPLASFRAAFAHAAVELWYAESDRAWPRLVCGSKWAECVRKGKTKLGSSAPSSQRRPVEAAPPSQPPAPAPQPPETLPWAPPANPRRLRDHLGARYQPLPNEGIYLRLDLYLARQQAQRSEAAE